MPGGLVQLSPDSGKQGPDWSAGYHYSDIEIAGFSHTHLSGAPTGDLCDILVTPTQAGADMPGTVTSPFSHDKEKASGLLVDLHETSALNDGDPSRRPTGTRSGAEAASLRVVDLGRRNSTSRSTRRSRSRPDDGFRIPVREAGRRIVPDVVIGDPEGFGERRQVRRSAREASSGSFCGRASRRVRWRSRR
jgi:hypothetical protein